MKICISSQGEYRSSNVDPRFGRCAYFAFYDTDSGEYSFEANRFAAGVGGVGVQTSQYMAEKGVQKILTGQVGPNAFKTLNAAGVEVYPDAAGTVEQAVQAFLKGEFEKTGGPTGPARHA
jgi:predicted Fe-Mo cluster-binding NifX family protein